MPDVEVRKDDLRSTRVAAGEARLDSAAEGEVQLLVERFGLTANNITYAVFGDAMSYWRFFPSSEDGWGRVPVWGFGDVVASGVEGIEPGERFYGYFPMSTYVTMRPEPTGIGFTDAAEHRRELPVVYNEYLRTPADGPYLDETLLLRPLFATSFLIERYLADSGWFGADAIVLSSASSKTAYGTAFSLARTGSAPDVVGLTSPGNRAFVESLDLYDRVLAYDEIADGLGGDAALVFVDMAGDAAVREAVHRAAGERLQRSVVVGATHWEEMAGGGELPGPAPELFFAPAHIERLRGELGPGELQRQMDEAWGDFVAQVGSWMEVVHGEGADAVREAWGSLVDGRADAARGLVLRLPELG